jgi:NADH:ubiquinone oxidoreductase subunit 2 (subunit N)
VLAALTMIVGTVDRRRQTNIKRMLAYSSIAHAGYLLLGIVAANRAGKAAILFYLLSYAVSEPRRARHRRAARHAGERARRAARFRRLKDSRPGPGRR